MQHIRKPILFFATLLYLCSYAIAQDATKFSTYYLQRLTHFRTLPQTKGDIIFLGNSITDGAEWSELFQDIHIKNRGISGDITDGVLYRLNEVADRKPAKIFLLIGVNDLAGNKPPDSVAKNIFLIAQRVRASSPSTQLYVQSILPVNDQLGKFPTHVNKSAQIVRVNQLLKDSASFYGYTFVDLHTSFCDASGKLNTTYTNDGLHLKGEGYLLWKHIIYPYVYGLQQKASLIPLPQSLQWNKGYFPLYACKTIVVTNPALQPEAIRLQQGAAKQGLVLHIANAAPPNEPYIELDIAPIAAPQLQEEAYQLTINNQRVSIAANTAHGVFSGLQSL